MGVKSAMQKPPNDLHKKIRLNFSLTSSSIPRERRAYFRKEIPGFEGKASPSSPVPGLFLHWGKPSWTSIALICPHALR